MPTNVSPVESAGQAILQEIVLGESQTYTPDLDAEVIVTVIGGGASGALSSNSARGIASGGQAGGFSQKKGVLKAGVSYVATVAAGGAAVETTGADGNAGGTSTFVGSDFNISAPGGNPGAQGTSTGSISEAGGTGAAIPTGGDINRVGGDGGDVSKAASTSARAAGGGGAVDIWGTGPHKGGEAAVNDIVATDPRAGGGGAGVNGAGGDIAFGTVTNSTNRTAPGGSTLQAGEFIINNVAVVVDTTPGIYGTNLDISPPSILSPVGGVGEPGGGSFSSVADAGIFGGSSGNPAGGSVTNGNPGRGGGSGGVSGGPSGAVATAGGSGIIIIQILRIL